MFNLNNTLITTRTKTSRKQNYLLLVDNLNAQRQIHLTFLNFVTKFKTMPKGGKRDGAGRPKGGQYGELTKTIRIPVSQKG